MTSASPRTRVTLCGALRLEIDGRDVATGIQGGQAGLITCYLLASPERAADRDALVDLLWPRDAPSDPGAGLRPLLSRLRRALAPATLEGRDRLRLVLPEPVWVDVDAAAVAVASARAAAQEQRWPEARDEAVAAVDLLRAGLLPGQDGDWLQARRWEHEELLLEALELAGRAGVALGTAGAAVAERTSRDLIARAPFRETGYRHLMEALAARGNVAEALRVYEQLRVLLRDELGIAPAAEIQALHLALLSGEWSDPRPAHQPAPLAAATPAASAHSELPAPLSLASPLPFAGRRDELATLRGLALGGTPGHAVLLHGAAGAGKSRLVREAAADAAGSGVLVLYGACDVEVRAPYGPFVEALDQLARVVGSEELRTALGPTAGELVRLLPGVGGLVGHAAAPLDADPDTQRHRLHTAVSDLLTGVARLRPVLLVVEDAQWADPPSLALLRHVVRTRGDGRVLLIVTFRDTETEHPEALAETLADLHRAEGVVRMPLSRLSTGEIGDFVRHAAGTDDDAQELASALAHATGGNPFLLCELWRTLLESDALEPRRGVVRLKRPLAELDVPDGVREIVRRRLAGLDPATRELLELAAAAGAEFDLDAVRPADGPVPVAALDEAVRSGLLEEVPSDQIAYRFAHELLRRAIYERTSRIRRATLHLRVGEALERASARSGRRLADLAHHFTLAAPAGEVERAVAYNVQAARAAAAALAFDAAAARLQAALDVGVVDPVERAEVLIELGGALHRAGRAPQALAAFERAAVQARELGHARLLARAAVEYEDACWRPGLVDAVALDLLEVAADALGDEPSQLRVRVLGALARTLWLRGNHGRGDLIRAEAIAAARALGDPAALARVLVGAMWSGSAPAELVLAELSEARDLAVTLRDRELEVEAMTWRAEALLAVCDVDAAEREIAAVRGMAVETAQPFQMHRAEHCEAAIALCQGRLADAESAAARSRDWSGSMQGADASAVFGVQMFCLRREQDRLAELAPLVRMLAGGDAADSWRPGLAALLAELDLAHEARSTLARVAADGLDALRASLWLASLTFLADACTAVGDAGVAALLYPEFEPLAGRNLIVGHVVACHGAADRFLGMLAATAGETDRAERHFEAALELNRRIGARTWLAHTAYQYGRMLLARDGGDRARAAALLGEAEDVAETVGLLALRRRLDSARPAWLPDGLSLRDARLLALLGGGLGNGEIGARLGVSEHTAAQAVRGLLRGTGLPDRREAAALAGRLGLAATD